MRTAGQIADEVMRGMDTMRQPYNLCVARVAEAIRAARIEAVEEFRRRALLACEEEHRFSKDRTRSHPFGARCWSRIAALPALPEEP